MLPGTSSQLSLYTGTFLIVLLPLVFVWGTTQLLKRRLRERLSRGELATLAFMLFNILFVTLLSNTLSTFENNRYRFPLDGFYVCLVAMAAQRVLGWRAAVAPTSEFNSGSSPPKRTSQQYAPVEDD